MPSHHHACCCAPCECPGGLPGTFSLSFHYVVRDSATDELLCEGDETFNVGDTGQPCTYDCDTLAECPTVCSVLQNYAITLNMASCKWEFSASGLIGAAGGIGGADPDGAYTDLSGEFGGMDFVFSAIVVS